MESDSEESEGSDGDDAGSDFEGDSEGEGEYEIEDVRVSAGFLAGNRTAGVWLTLFLCLCVVHEQYDDQKIAGEMDKGDVGEAVSRFHVNDREEGPLQQAR